MNLGIKKFLSLLFGVALIMSGLQAQEDYYSEERAPQEFERQQGPKDFERHQGERSFERRHQGERSFERRHQGQQGFERRGMSGNKRRKRGPCAMEVRKICGGIRPGQGRIVACVEENISKLSSKCQEMAKKKKAEHEKRKACRQKIESICGVRENGGRGHLRQCLADKKDLIPENCRKSRKKRAKERRGQGRHQRQES